jgi:hypothetical protein
VGEQNFRRAMEEDIYGQWRPMGKNFAPLKPLGFQLESVPTVSGTNFLLESLFG